MSRGLIYIGLTHHGAPLEIRERCTPQRSALTEMLRSLADSGLQGAVLSTCGRIELYAVAAPGFSGQGAAGTSGCGQTAGWRVDEPGAEELAAPWMKRFAALCGRPLAEVQPFVSIRTDRQAARQLLCVAAGLDSQILGEDQVIAQVREAYAMAQSAGSCGAVLSSLFRGAIRAGRRARHETGIGRIPGSFAALAMGHLHGQADPATIRRVLIIGSGRMAEDVAAAMQSADEARRPDGSCPSAKPTARIRAEVVIAARSRERAGLLAARVGGRAVGLEALANELSAADVVFACMASSRFVITAADVARARGGGACGPAGAGVRQCLHVIDLGMPRNVEPAVGRLAGVHLVGLAELAPASAVQTGLLEAANAIVDQELDVFEKWLRARAAAPAVARLARMIEHCEPHERPELRRRLHGRIMRLKEGHAA